MVRSGSWAFTYDRSNLVPKVLSYYGFVFAGVCFALVDRLTNINLIFEKLVEVAFVYGLAPFLGYTLR